jgi:site-specific recombinase XerC
MHTDPFIVYLKTEKRYSFHTLKAYENDLRSMLISQTIFPRGILLRITGKSDNGWCI